MEITSLAVAVQAEAGSMPATLARPADESKYPAVIVVHEAFGLNAHINDVAARLAREGYVTLAPDLYYRENRSAAYDDLQEAVRLMMTLRDDTIVQDMGAAISYLQQQPFVYADRIGVMGFCMGGRIAFLTACMSPAIRAGVPFYGGGIGGAAQPAEGTRAPLDFAERLTAPLLLFFGETDAFIPLEEVERIRHRLAHLGKDATIVVYPGAPHGFFCDQRESYQPKAARDAWQQLLQFFGRRLQGETAQQ
jgi:carboxymethylenebutenolidase